MRSEAQPITGATGTIGREVIGQLPSSTQVLAVTRNPRAVPLPARVEVVRGDPSSPETVAAALHGVEAILISPRTVGNSTPALMSLAAEHGVRRAVVISALTASARICRLRI